ncbi:hypothetical protein KQI42_00150 [Tissierella sp. MSJ-40]|uniref:Uncharacterized protein n=1 Tax=Tissierella simiarum TaxID=2841534 RepID=A0ABS6E0T1_9FIRM|nr:hypothetical protein [Tissierella simiarum]MBU5436399.1 hypothetical protein [Tissierella simiarum]
MFVYKLRFWTLSTIWGIWFILALIKKKNSDDRFIWFGIVPMVLSLMTMNVI